MKHTETPTRSWFLALYLPVPYQWPMIAAMLALGLVMLTTGRRLTSVRAVRTWCAADRRRCAGGSGCEIVLWTRLPGSDAVRP
jgi:hypothetical protein